MNNLLSKSGRFLRRNSATVLTIAGAAGVVATSITAVKATPKALRLVDEAREEKGEDLTRFEKVRVAGPAYIPSILLGASTIACIFGANILNQRQQAALVSAYALVENSYKEYKQKVIELYGEEADEKIRHEIIKDKYNAEIVEVEDGGEKRLFFDYFSGRYFESTLGAVKDAEYELNKMLMKNEYVYLNEWYAALGIDVIDGGWELGWTRGGNFDKYWQDWIDITHERCTLDDGLECIILIMNGEPYPNFEDYC